MAADDKLASSFQNPPNAARMWTWWFWLGDHVDKASITADLEALKSQGIGGVTVYSLSGPGVAERGPDYLGPEWRELWKHTLKEADRLGLGVSATLCSGWNCGGPWTTPEQACKRHVSAQLVLSGPKHFHGVLPKPPHDPRFYRDVAVQAFPIITGEPEPELTASSSHSRYPLANAMDDDTNTFWVSNGERLNEGPRKDKPEWLQIDLGDKHVIKSVTIIPRPGYGPRDAELQISVDGSAFTTLQSLTMDRETPTDLVMPETPTRFVRLLIATTWSPQSENVQVCEIKLDGKSLRHRLPADQLSWKTIDNSFGDCMGTPIQEVCDAPRRPFPPQESATALDPAKVVDLTTRCGSDGTLDWQVPDGKWILVRTGCTLTGAMTNCSTPTGGGLEADPLDAAAMDTQFAKVAQPLIEDAGPLAGKTFQSVQIDSWENGLPNWTMDFVEQFKKRRRYDPRPYLPVLAGYIVGNAEIADRFLYDYRKTVAECVAESCFGRLSRLAQSRGIVQQSEAGGVCCPKVMALDALANLGRCAIPMGEFWQDGQWIEANQNKNGKQTATAAHLYGKPIAAAEAFSSMLHWADSPASLKPTADRAFCEGFNHFFIFSSATHSGDGTPGTEYFAGTFFNRKITWWNQARCFTDYVARCSHLLQEGRFAADVLFYNGDGAPNFVSPKHVDPALGPGYDYDVCNSEALLTRLAVRDGRIVLPDGMTYRMLVLPDRRDMPLAIARKLRELVAAGMTLVGPKPEQTPGLEDYPKCDQQLKDLAAELWGECDGKTVKEHPFGKGRVVCGITPREIFARLGVGPDFTCASPQVDAFIDWIHRSDQGAEIYFLSNRRNRPEKAACTFRVAGKQPELWDPVDGLMRDAAAFRQTATGETVLPLAFAPNGSLFVVFRKPISGDADGPATSNDPLLKAAGELTGSWSVAFDPQWGGPPSIEFPGLEDWAKRPEPGIKFYSGTARYAKTFDLPQSSAASGKRIFLDLGDVQNLAEVKLNGVNLGTAWTAPWRVDITPAVKPAGNRLEIAVTNLWPNRLIGDAALPPEKRLTQTNMPYRADQPLLSSGLLGPITLMMEE
jgi:hypothetical protein